jgi:hypothetical protein
LKLRQNSFVFCTFIRHIRQRQTVLIDLSLLKLSDAALFSLSLSLCVTAASLSRLLLLLQYSLNFILIFIKQLL